jgi:hypothetical protein
VSRRSSGRLGATTLVVVLASAECTGSIGEDGAANDPGDSSVGVSGAESSPSDTIQGDLDSGASPDEMITAADADVSGACAEGTALDVGDGAIIDWCGCTRGAGAQPSPQCPVGVGEMTTAIIGEEGGTVSLAGRQSIVSGVAAEVDFPPSAFTSTTVVILTETTLPPPSGLLDWSPVYLLQPLTSQLATPATVRLPWSNSAANAVGLSIWTYNNAGCWTPLADSQTGEGFEQATIETLEFLVVGTTAAAASSACAFAVAPSDEEDASSDEEDASSDGNALQDAGPSPSDALRMSDAN